MTGNVKVEREGRGGGGGGLEELRSQDNKQELLLKVPSPAKVGRKHKGVIRTRCDGHMARREPARTLVTVPDPPRNDQLCRLSSHVFSSRLWSFCP